jgi:4-amino-4-deoxy-L-arabinose transferase-like glycosyltransferase
MGVRVGFVFQESRKIPREALASVPFQNEVGNVAAAVSEGKGFCCVFREPSGPTAWLAPVYPLLIAAIFKVFGAFTASSFYAAALMNCLFSALACFPVFFAGKRIAGIPTAASAAWLWAFFPSGIMMPFEWIWDTSLSALLAAGLLWATLYVADHPGLRNSLLYGLLWGITLLTNPTFGVLLPFLLGWILVRQRSRGKGSVGQLAACVALMAAMCVPWTLRNAVQFHRFVPIRSNFAFELWLGNNEIFDEHSRAVNRITRFEQIHIYGKLGETTFLEEKWRGATNFLRTHPALALRLFARRVVATWLGTEAPWNDLIHADSPLVRFLFMWNAITLVGGVLGLVRLYRTRRFFFLPVAAFPLVFPMVYYLTHTSLRYRHPCDPGLALLLALLATWAWDGSMEMQKNGK